MPFPNKGQRRANRQAYKEKQGQLQAQRGKVIAKFSPGVTAIRLFANGDIVSSMHSSGSAIGAVAKVDQAGSQRIFRDTRQSYLTIEGPHISLAAKLASNSGVTVKSARQFAAAVNQWSQSHAGPAAGSPPAPIAGNSSNTLERLERLGKLRESGVLTEEEFAAQKSAILNAN